MSYISLRESNQMKLYNDIIYNIMERIPKNELKKVIDAQFNYDRRKYIFWAFNTTYFGIALFQIYSDVNIEGGENIALC